MNIIFAVLVTLMVFFCGILLLFSLNVEFISVILLLLVVGAFLILIIFTMFLLSQHTQIQHTIRPTSTLFLSCYVAFVLKLIVFFSSLPTFGITQLTITHQLSETRAFLTLFDLVAINSYGLMLLIIGFLLFILTISVSFLLKSK
jgi:NADH:ubiquinone oxidoreductase subunit 6 (subunit J)